MRGGAYFMNSLVKGACTFIKRQSNFCHDKQEKYLRVDQRTGGSANPTKKDKRHPQHCNQKGRIPPILPRAAADGRTKIGGIISIVVR